MEDPYYGQEEMATLCTNFITHLFGCPKLLPNPESPTTAMPLKKAIAYALRRTRLPPTTVFAGLYLLERLKARFPEAKGASGHRLFITASMVACKLVLDDSYSNKSWGVAALNTYPLKDLSEMERDMLRHVDWDLSIDPIALLDFGARVERVFKGPGPYSTYNVPDPAVHANTPFTGPPMAMAGRAPHTPCRPRAQRAPAPPPPAAPARPSARSPSSSPMDLDPAPIPASPSTDSMECTPELSGSMSASPAWSMVSPATPAGYEDRSVPVIDSGRGRSARHLWPRCTGPRLKLL